MRIIWERLKVVIEPSAAVGLAAILSNNFKLKWLQEENSTLYKKIGVVLCGGNVDLNQVGMIFSSSI